MSENQPAKLNEREIIFGFGKRLRGQAYNSALEFLIERDGKACKKCKREDQGQTIDHINPEAKPLHSSLNMQILCFRCNSAKSSKVQSYLGKRERENKPQLEVPVPTEQDSYSNSIAFHREPKFRLFIFTLVRSGLKDKATYSLEYMVKNASAYAKIGLSTGYKWMAVICCDEGPFKDPEKTDGQIEFQVPEFRFLNEEELLELFHPDRFVSDERKHELMNKAEKLARENEIL